MQKCLWKRHIGNIQILSRLNRKSLFWFNNSDIFPRFISSGMPDDWYLWSRKWLAVDGNGFFSLVRLCKTELGLKHLITRIRNETWDVAIAGMCEKISRPLCSSNQQQWGKLSGLLKRKACLNETKEKYTIGVCKYLAWSQLKSLGWNQIRIGQWTFALVRSLIHRTDDDRPIVIVNNDQFVQSRLNYIIGYLCFVQCIQRDKAQLKLSRGTHVEQWQPDGRWLGEASTIECHQTRNSIFFAAKCRDE